MLPVLDHDRERRDDINGGVPEEKEEKEEKYAVSIESNAVHHAARNLAHTNSPHPNSAGEHETLHRGHVQVVRWERGLGPALICFFLPLRAKLAFAQLRAHDEPNDAPAQIDWRGVDQPHDDVSNHPCDAKCDVRIGNGVRGEEVPILQRSRVEIVLRKERNDGDGRVEEEVEGLLENVEQQQRLLLVGLRVFPLFFHAYFDDQLRVDCLAEENNDLESKRIPLVV